MRETSTVRISFRSTVARLQRLRAVAEKHGWLNAKDEPNLSAVLNYIIDRFDLKRDKRRKSDG